MDVDAPDKSTTCSLLYELNIFGGYQFVHIRLWPLPWFRWLPYKILTILVSQHLSDLGYNLGI